MSENPRIPGGPSDGISSRTDEGRVQHTNPTPVNVYNTPANAPAPATGNSHLKNLIIGSIITAVASISVYYATVYMNRSKGSNESFEETRQATSSAWGSLVAYENAYARNLLSFEKNFVANANFTEYLSGLKTESSKFSRDLGDISKLKNLDIDLVKAINRRLDNERVALGKAEEFILGTQQLLYDTVLSPKTRTENLIRSQVDWNRYSKGLYERTINDLQEIANTLSERYNKKFLVSELLVVQMMPQRIKSHDSLMAILENTVVEENGTMTRKNDPDGNPFVISLKDSDIIGNWNVDGNSISFQKNGKITWVLPGGAAATGTWKLEAGKIRADVIIDKTQKQATWYMRVSSLTSSSLTLTNALAPYDTYHLVRILTN